MKKNRNKRALSPGDLTEFNKGQPGKEILCKAIYIGELGRLGNRYYRFLSEDCSVHVVFYREAYDAFFESASVTVAFSKTKVVTF